MLWMCWLVDASSTSSVNVSFRVLELVMVCYYIAAKLLMAQWVWFWISADYLMKTAVRAMSYTL